MENESLIGFEVELLVGPRSKYYIAMPNPETEVETLSFSRVSDISDLAEVPGISEKDLQKLKNIYQHNPNGKQSVTPVQAPNQIQGIKRNNYVAELS